MYRIDVRGVLAALWSRSATALALGFVALFVQAAQGQGPLNYFQNYFVTGDYVVGGVGLYGKTANPTGTINFSGVPCTSGPGLFASVVPCSTKGAVPADIIAAFLYWETIEPTSSTSPSATAGTFDGASNTIAGLPLGNPQIAACVVGGGTQSKTSYARVYRADVLRYLVINSTANVRTANYTHTVQFSGNPAGTQFNGATLVVVYRLVTPGNPRIAPLRSVVIYDGAFTGVASKSPSLNQTMGGFYQASSGPDAKMTHIVGGGEANFHETLTVNGNIPEGVDSDPLDGAQGANWDNYTFNYNLSPNASSVQTAVQSTNDCLSWAAIITSMKVQDSDFDGLLDVWEKSGLYRNPGVRNDGILPQNIVTPTTAAAFGTCAQYPQDPANCVNLPAMGANPFVPDIFVQVDWMQYQGSLVSAAGGSASVPDHIHNPQLAALNMVGSMFKSHGINLHFDAGSSNTYQGQGSPYIIPAAYAQGGNVVQESSVLCLASNNNNIPCEFTPQTQEYSVLGWKIGFTAIRDGASDLGLPQLFARNRLSIFHYSLFGHGIAATTPLSAPAAGSISGVGDLPGGDFMVTLGLWRSDTPSVDQVGTLLDQAGTLGHELGHNLGLGHGGWNGTPVCKPDYPSIMNYLYQVQGLTDSAGNEHLDYSYGLLLPLSENALSVKIPMGIQAYRVRYFGPLNSIPGSPLANTPGQASKVYCNGNLLNGSEGPYVRLEGPTVSTPDWSNGTVKLGTTLPPLFINYDGIPGETFTDSPDWISLNLQQVGARPNVDGVSLDLGRSDLGRSDLGRSDLGRSDLGRSDLGRSDLGTAALGQDALGDFDNATNSLSGVKPPVNLTATVTTTTPPFSNPNPGGTGVLLNWMPALGAAYDHYNIYFCNASAAAACTPTTLIASVPGGTPTPSYTVYVNDFVDAGATCPATNICYNTPFNFFVTGVVQVANLSSESGGSNPVSSEVYHAWIIANAQPTVTYGATTLPFPAPTYTLYPPNSATTFPYTVPTSSCVYSSPSSTPRNAATYTITCSGPSAVPGTPTVGVSYNVPNLNYPASLGGTVTQGTLTITKAQLTITAAAETKNYDGTKSVPLPLANAPTITGLQTQVGYGDSVTGLAETYTEQPPNAGTGLTLVVSAYTVSDGNSGANYNVTTNSSSAAGIIKPAPLTASIINNPTKPYDGNTTATLISTNFSLSGLASGESFTVTQTVGAYNSPNVTTATTVTANLTSGNFTPVGATLASNYTLPSTASGPGQITAVTLTASIIGNPTSPTKTYDGTTTATLAPTNFSLSHLVGTEGFTVTQTVGAYNSANVASATTVTANLMSSNFTPVAPTLASNYVLPSTASGTGTITQATATITVTAYNVPYDGTAHTAAGTATGVGVPPANLIADLTLSGTTHSNAATYGTDPWSFTDPAGNYRTASGTVSDVINKAALTITALTNTKPYDATTSAAAIPTPSGLKGTDTVTGLSETYDTPTPGTNKTLSVATTYTVNDSNSGGNYNVSLATNTTGVINQAVPTVVDNGPPASTYGQPVTLSVTVTPPSGGTPTGTVTFSFTQNSTTYYVCADGSVSSTQCTVPVTLSGSNYVASVSTSKLPTEADSVMATYSGDTDFQGEPASNLSVTVSQASSAITLMKSQNPSNYGDPVDLTVKVKDNTTNSTGVPTGTMTLSFKLDPSNPTAQLYYVCADGSISTTVCAGANQITLAPDATDPLGLTGAATVHTTNLPAGLSSASFLYAINAAYSGDTNFAASGPFGLSQTVNQRSITVTAAVDTKPYDGTTSSAGAPTITAGSLASTDTANFTQTFDTRNAGTGKTLTPAGSVNDGFGGNNYAITFTPVSTGVIQAVTLTITATTNTKNYDGTTSAAATPTVTGLKGSDTVTGLSETYNTAIPGTGKTLSVATYTVNDGNSGGNYNVSLATNTTGVINSTLSLTPATLAGGDQGVLYQPQQLVASGGTGLYVNWNWTPAVSSALPPGLSLDPSLGTITGTPTAAGTYTFIVSVTDSSAAMASQTDSITVNLPPTITGGALPVATVGTPYSQSIPVSNGASPFSWSATGLPAGLTIANGVISGTATGGSFAPPYDAPSWTATASNGGTTSITPNCLANVNVTDAVGGSASANVQVGSTPSSPCAAFGYNRVLAGGGVPVSTWSFSDTAATTGTLTFNWQYVGFHAFFQVTALLQVFSGSNAVTLYSAGPVDCCSSPSGGFNVQGTGTIAVTVGQPFGFTVGGSNFDSNAVLQGTLYITNFAIHAIQ